MLVLHGYCVLGLSKRLLRLLRLLRLRLILYCIAIAPLLPYRCCIALLPHDSNDLCRLRGADGLGELIP